MTLNRNSDVRKVQSVDAIDCTKTATMTLPQLLYHVLTGEASAFQGASAAKPHRPRLSSAACTA